VIKRQTLTSQVFDHILNLIKSGQIQPGEKLPTEKQMTAELGVSRTCVREAVKSLESLRLVSVRPRVGAVVLELSASAVFNAESLSEFTHSQATDVLIEFRKIVEVGLASLAAEKASNEDLAAMLRAMEVHKRALETDRIAYPADIAFHEAIADASKNPIAIMVLKMISEPLQEQRRRTNEVLNAPEEGLREHWKVFKAIKSRDPARARAAMRAHMDTAERNWQIASATPAIASPRSAAATETDPPPQVPRQRIAEPGRARDRLASLGLAD
jgi:GntR family transcriptional repressor for pyruvate dehydrogenase complex